MTSHVLSLGWLNMYTYDSLFLWASFPRLCPAHPRSCPPSPEAHGYMLPLPLPLHVPYVSKVLMWRFNVAWLVYAFSFLGQ